LNKAETAAIDQERLEKNAREYAESQKNELPVWTGDGPMPAGYRSGYSQIRVGSDGLKYRHYTDGRVVVVPAKEWSYDPDKAEFCGAPTADGSRCQNKVKGGGFCHHHSHLLAPILAMFEVFDGSAKRPVNDPK